jgi:hypothetical protein
MAASSSTVRFAPPGLLLRDLSGPGIQASVQVAAHPQGISTPWSQDRFGDQFPDVVPNTRVVEDPIKIVLQRLGFRRFPVEIFLDQGRGLRGRTVHGELPIFPSKGQRPGVCKVPDGTALICAQPPRNGPGALGFAGPSVSPAGRGRVDRREIRPARETRQRHVLRDDRTAAAP